MSLVWCAIYHHICSVTIVSQRLASLTRDLTPVIGRLSRIIRNVSAGYAIKNFYLFLGFNIIIIISLLTKNCLLLGYILQWRQKISIPLLRNYYWNKVIWMIMRNSPLYVINFSFVFLPVWFFPVKIFATKIQLQYLAKM